MKFILIETDGYSIETRTFENLEDAQKQMGKQYETWPPTGGLTDSYEESSYLGNMDAQLYTNGMDVFTWKIISV